MKKFLYNIFRLACIILVIGLGVLLGMKLKNDTITAKNEAELKQNIEYESNYIIENSMNDYVEIKEEVEKQVKQKVELADSGSIINTELYFVTKVDNQYRYICKTIVDGVETFSIAKTNEDGNKYIIPASAIIKNECIYTELENYTIDKNGIIKYIGY